MIFTFYVVFPILYLSSMVNQWKMSRKGRKLSLVLPTTVILYWLWYVVMLCRGHIFSEEAWLFFKVYSLIFSPYLWIDLWLRYKNKKKVGKK